MSNDMTAIEELHEALNMAGDTITITFEHLHDGGKLTRIVHANDLQKALKASAQSIRTHPEYQALARHHNERCTCMEIY